MWDFSHDYFWGHGDKDADERAGSTSTTSLNSTSRTSLSHDAGVNGTGNGTICSHGIVGFFSNPWATVKYSHDRQTRPNQRLLYTKTSFLVTSHDQPRLLGVSAIRLRVGDAAKASTAKSRRRDAQKRLPGICQPQLPGIVDGRRRRR